MQFLFWIFLAFAGGYAAAIYTWEKLRKFLLGAEAEYKRLEKKARDLKADLKAKL